MVVAISPLMALDNDMADDPRGGWDRERADQQRAEAQQIATDRVTLALMQQRVGQIDMTVREIRDEVRNGFNRQHADMTKRLDQMDVEKADLSAVRGDFTALERRVASIEKVGWGLITVIVLGVLGAVMKLVLDPKPIPGVVP